MVLMMAISYFLARKTTREEEAHCSMVFGCCLANSWMVSKCWAEEGGYEEQHGAVAENKACKASVPPKSCSHPLQSCCPHRAVLGLASPQGGQQTWAGPGSTGNTWMAPAPVQQGSAISSGGLATLSGGSTAGYHSPNQQDVFLLCHGKMLPERCLEGLPVLSRLAKCATRPSSHKSIWRIKSQNDK